MLPGSTPASSIWVTLPIASRVYLSCWNHTPGVPLTVQRALISSSAPVAVLYSYARRRAGTEVAVARDMVRPVTRPQSSNVVDFTYRFVGVAVAPSHSWSG